MSSDRTIEETCVRNSLLDPSAELPERNEPVPAGLSSPDECPTDRNRLRKPAHSQDREHSANSFSPTNVSEAHPLLQPVLPNIHPSVGPAGDLLRRELLPIPMSPTMQESMTS